MADNTNPASWDLLLTQAVQCFFPKNPPGTATATGSGYKAHVGDQGFYTADQPYSSLGTVAQH